MVGAKSLGCKTCKKRRIKRLTQCDERRPICANCERRQLYCPGAQSRYFHLTVSELSPQTKPQSTILDSDAGSEKDITDSQDQDRTWKQLIINQRLTKPVPSTPATLLTQSLLDTLRNPSKAGFQLHLLGHYFHFLPSRMGHHALLDTAINCLLHGHRSLLGQNQISKFKHLKRYIHAISLLRDEVGRLERRKGRATAETLCAAIILANFELFTSDSVCSYITHAGGISALIEACGPRRFVSDFELALFEAHYGSIIGSSLLSGKLCFLAQPSWETVCQRSALFKSPSLKDNDIIMYNTEPCLAKLSLLLNDIQDAQLDFRTGNLDPTKLRSLTDRVNVFRQHNLKAGAQLEAALEDPHTIAEVPCLANEASPGVSTKYKFCSPSYAANFGHYWACRIIANRLLLRIRDLETLHLTQNQAEESLKLSNTEMRELSSLLLKEESCDIARRICSSVPYTKSHAPFAGIHMIFALEVALLASDTERKVWITNELRELLSRLGLEMSLDRMEMTAELLTGGIVE